MSRWTPWERRDDWRDGGRPRRPAKPWLTTLAWRCRYELVAAGGTTTGVVWLVDVLGPQPAMAVMVATAAGGVSVPRVRHVAGLAWWHVITPHLFRHACGDLGLFNSRGRVPAVIRTRTRREAQRVTVWCWPSVSIIDLRKAQDELATGMQAQAVSVTRHDRFGHIAVVTVVRDDRRLLDRLKQDDEWGHWDDRGFGDEAAFMAVPPQRGPQLGVEGGVA